MQPLDPRYVRLERVAGFVLAGILAVAALGGLAALATAASTTTIVTLAGAWLAGTIALCWFAWAWPAKEYRHAGYALGSDMIEICRGVLWRHRYRVPRSRVQHTDVAQGPLERRYGLATLVLHTAGTKHARVELAGLAHETALALRDQLLPRAEPDAV